MPKTIPEQLADAQSKIEELTQAAATHGTALEAALNQSKEFEGKAKEAEAKVAELVTEKGKLETNISSLNAKVSEFEGKVKDLEAKEQDIAKRADALATDRMASVGQTLAATTDPKGANAGQTIEPLTGLAAVEAEYRKKYEAK